MAVYTKRTTGADIPPDAKIAILKDGVTVGYAGSDAAADNYIKTTSDKESHEKFFKENDKLRGTPVDAVVERLENATPQEARQSMRRIAAFEAQFTNMLLDRAAPGGGPDFFHCTWEQFTTMHNEYKEAEKAGEGKGFAFQPVSTYVNKLISTRRDGSQRVVRQLYSNEMGVWTDRSGHVRIVCLKDQGPGDAGEKYFQVPGQAKETDNG